MLYIGAERTGRMLEVATVDDLDDGEVVIPAMRRRMASERDLPTERLDEFGRRLGPGGSTACRFPGLGTGRRRLLGGHADHAHGRCCVVAACREFAVLRGTSATHLWPTQRRPRYLLATRPHRHGIADPDIRHPIDNALAAGPAETDVAQIDGCSTSAPTARVACWRSSPSMTSMTATSSSMR